MDIEEAQTAHFTKEDHNLHRRVYNAFKDGPESETISSIRNEVVESHDKLSTFIVAFSEILETHEYEHDDEMWIAFNKILKDQVVPKDLKPKERLRLEHLAFICMQWSPEVASYYGWTDGHKLSRDKTRKLYQCAKLYTGFKEHFIPHINLMRWLQKCADVQVLDSMRTPNKEPSDGDFKEEHLKFLVQLHRSGTICEFGLSISLGSTARMYEQAIQTWTNSKESRVNLLGKMIDLRSLRRDHWKLLLFKYDKNGLLVQRRVPGVGSVSQGCPETVNSGDDSEVHGEGLRPANAMTAEPLPSREQLAQDAAVHSTESIVRRARAISSTLASESVSEEADSEQIARTRSSKDDRVGPCDRVRDNTIAPFELTRSLEGQTMQSFHFGYCPQDCVCDLCQELRPFFEMIRSDALKSNASSVHQARQNWLDGARWATRSDTLESEQDDALHPEVLSLDERAFEHFAKANSELKRPIIIRNNAENRALPGVHTARTVQHNNRSTDKPENLLSLLNDENISVCCVLRSPLQVRFPAVIMLDRFSLLQRASMRTFDLPADSNDSLCYCNDATHAAYVANGLSRVRVEASGAFSGPHVSAFGGSCFRTLAGRRLCIFAEERGVKKIPHAGWQPSKNARLTLLEHNDVLILPPNFVFAHLAVDPSATLEGNFWDERDLKRYLKATRMAKRSPSLATEVPPCVLRRGLDGYQIIAGMKLSKRSFQSRHASQHVDQRSTRESSRLPCENSAAELAVNGVSNDFGGNQSRPDKEIGSYSSRRFHNKQESRGRRSKRVCLRK